MQYWQRKVIQDIEYLVGKGVYTSAKGAEMIKKVKMGLDPF